MSRRFSEVFPELLAAARDVHSTLIPVAMVILFAALVFSAWHGSMAGDTGSMLRSVGSVGILAVVILMFPDWVDELTHVAQLLIRELDVDPSEVHLTFAQLLTGAAQGQDVGFWDVLWADEGGIGKAFIYLSVWLLGKIAWLVVWLAYLLQHIIAVLAIATSPIMLAMFSINATRGVAVKFLLSLFGVILWPLGWAIANIVTEALLQLAVNNRIYVITEHDSILFGNQTLAFILLLGLWMLVSTIAAPIVISKAIQSGSQVGASFLSSMAAATGQGLSYGVGGGVTASLAGASPATALASGVAGGSAGLASGAMGSSGVLVPAAIGTMAIAATSGASASSASEARLPLAETSTNKLPKLPATTDNRSNHETTESNRYSHHPPAPDLVLVRPVSYHHRRIALGTSAPGCHSLFRPALCHRR